MGNRVFLAVAIFALLITAGVTGWIIFDRSTQKTTMRGDGLVVTTANIGGGFSLIDEDGKPTTEQKFDGKYALVYFGYSFCPDVCPTGLQTISAAVEKLGNNAQKVVPVFISVDPERDTPQQLKQYTELFHNRMEGLTGSKAQIDALTKKFKVYYAIRKDQDPENYPVDHSSFTYLMGPDWKILAVFRHEVTPDQIAAAIKSTF
jgi:cytochrome oxidase Cu insertion factor (SCO1/SenC/PrrC family)